LNGLFELFFDFFRQKKRVVKAGNSFKKKAS
jgi:hypothetical protein